MPDCEAKLCVEASGEACGKSEGKLPWSAVEDMMNYCSYLCKLVCNDGTDDQ